MAWFEQSGSTSPVQLMWVLYGWNKPNGPAVHFLRAFTNSRIVSPLGLSLSLIWWPRPLAPLALAIGTTGPSN